MQSQTKSEVPTLLGLHPAATLFPVMSDEEFKALVEDIREHGQLEPIIVIDGQVIDGRHRLQACEALGIEPKTVEFDGDPNEIYLFVISKNLHRRHLSVSQRAMIAARITNLAVGSNQHIARVTHDPNTGEEYSPPMRVVVSSLNIDRKSAQFGKTVVALGIPSLASKVDGGEITVSAAAVFAKTEPARQAQIVAMPTAERREELQRIKAEQGVIRQMIAKAREKHGENNYVRFLEKNLRQPNADEAQTIAKLDGLTTPDGHGTVHSPLPPPTAEKKAEDARQTKLFGDAYNLDHALYLLAQIEGDPAELVKFVRGPRIERVGARLDTGIEFLTAFAKEWHHAQPH